MANPLSLKDIADFKIPASGLVDDSDPTFSYYSSGSVPLYDRSYIKNKSANRTMFFPPEYVLIERSTDGGATWTTVPTSGTNSVTLDQRRNLMGEVATNIAVGVGEQTTSMQMRITLKYTGGFYCSLDRAFIDFNMVGHSCEVKMDASTYGAQSTYTDIFGWKGISGWPGPNLYKFPYKTAWGTNSSAHLYNVRFTFKYLSINSSYKNNSATVRMLNLYGVNYWGTAGEPRDNGFLYKWDSSKNVTFPTKVYSGSYKLTAEKELTQAQYDALSDADKKNGTAYFITDGQLGTTKWTPVRVATLNIAKRSVSGNAWHNLGFVASTSKYNTDYVSTGASDGASGTALQILKAGRYLFMPSIRHTDFGNATTDCAWGIAGVTNGIEHWQYDKNRGAFDGQTVEQCAVGNQCFFSVFREGASMDWANTRATMEVFYLGD